jgi:glycosyltransferase involved in cell wall biosynthesis
MWAFNKMKVIQVFNYRKGRGGEEFIFENTVEILRRWGTSVEVWSRNLEELGQGLLGRAQAAMSGVYSFSSARQMRHLIRKSRPDLVHAHNIYPQLSPSIFAACQSLGVPVIWHRHDHRPMCPTGQCFLNGRTCELCVGGREYHCVLKNCRKNFAESIAYATRTNLARKLRLLTKNVTLFIAPSEYLKNCLEHAGYGREKTVVVHHPVNVSSNDRIPYAGKYVGYVGRVSAEKGVGTLVSAAALVPHISVSIAGDASKCCDVLSKAPKSVSLLGGIPRTHLKRFYRGARFVVIPSICFDVFPTVALEALSHGIPVIGSRIGGIPEIVQDGITGFLFEPGNVDELAGKMRLLWENPDLCRQMGRAGRKLVSDEHSEDAYYRDLLDVYEKAIEIQKNHSKSSDAETKVCVDIGLSRWA